MLSAVAQPPKQLDNATLQALRSIPFATSSGGFPDGSYLDKATNRIYNPVYNVEFDGYGEDAVRSYVPIAFSGTEVGKWFPGKKAQLYNLDGAFSSEVVIEDPSKDLGAKLTLGFITFVAGGAFGSFFRGGDVMKLGDFFDMDMGGDFDPTGLDFADVSGGDWGVDPTEINFDAVDFSTGDWGIDPTTIDYETLDWSGVQLTPDIANVDLSAIDVPDYSGLTVEQLESVNPDFADALKMNGTATGSYSDMVTEQLANVDKYFTPEQIGELGKLTPQTKTALQQAVKMAGGSVAKVISPATATKAATVATAKASVGGGSAWDEAARVLSLYAQYQMKAKYGPLPGQTQLPGAKGMTRQPDGSITYRNANGTYTTVKPNGATSVSNSLQGITSFLQSNSTPLLIGAAVIVGVLLLKGK